MLERRRYEARVETHREVLANGYYRNDNPQKKRIPKGFADEVSLKVTEIGDASAIPKIAILAQSKVRPHLEF